jgi:chaperonin cofactor prefoldin
MMEQRQLGHQYHRDLYQLQQVRSQISGIMRQKVDMDAFLTQLYH